MDTHTQPSGAATTHKRPCKARIWIFLITIHNVNFSALYIYIHHHSASAAFSDMPPTYPQPNRKSQTALLRPTTTSVTSQGKKAITRVLLPSSSPCRSPVRPRRPPPSIITSTGATPIPTPTTTTLTGSPRRNTAPTPPAGQISPCPPNYQRLASIHNAVIRVLLLV